MSTPSKPEELYEIVEKAAGVDAMQMLVDKHLNSLMALRDQIAIKDFDLLSSQIATNKNVDSAVKERIASLHMKMRMLVQEVAKRIENQKYKKSEDAIAGLELSRTQTEDIKALVAADKTIHISCQSLKVAVELFFELNRQIVQRLESASNIAPSDERKLLLGNALLVYELTDFVMNFISDFRLHGTNAIEAIHKVQLRTIEELREEAKSLRKQADSTEIEESLRERVLQNIDHRDESIKVLEGEWASYMETVRSLQVETASVSKKIPSLRLIRDNAKAQINTLAAVAVLQIVQSNIRAIEATVLQLEKIELASLSADRVRRLLGI
jgi:hypothetical protein